jgi:hypothetical protein
LNQLDLGSLDYLEDPEVPGYLDSPDYLVGPGVLEDLVVLEHPVALGIL